MKDNLSVACGDIRKKLKAFLDDLLAEDERQAFVAHLDGCGECKDYVRKIGSVSNQLWELGGVNAPSDLSSTILFRLKQAEQEIRSAESRVKLLIIQSPIIQNSPEDVERLQAVINRALNRIGDAKGAIRGGETLEQAMMAELATS